MAGMGTMFLIIAGLLAIGVPIGVSLAIGMLALISINPIMSLQYVAQSLYSGLDSFTLIAIPFFMMAGSIMEVGGLSKRLVRAANSVVGNVTGNLGLVTVLSCMFFGAVSGSAMATVAAIGGVMLPEMVRNGYDKVYATALVAVAGSLGIIVPPSSPMVVFGVTNNVSIGALFLGGFGPAAVVGGLLMIMNYVMCKRLGYKGTGGKINIKNVLVCFKDAIWALIMPLIILGGIYSGIFTATEAAVVSCTYGIIVGRYIYKELNFKKLWEIFMENVSFMGGLLFTFAPIAAMGALFALLKVPILITNMFLSITDSPSLIFLMIFGLLIIIGMLMQSTPAILLFSPILMPVATAVGINPVHFGVFMVVALGLGFVTPPVAMNLFVAQSMTGINIVYITKKAWPFIWAMIAAALIIMYVPGITLGLLNILGFVY